MTATLNPAWKQYNDLHNEGGEGYNPHPKYLGETNAAEALDCTAATMSGGPGRAISRSEAEYLLSEEARLLKDAEVRAKCGDLSAAVAIEGIKARVAHYATQVE